MVQINLSETMNPFPFTILVVSCIASICSSLPSSKTSLTRIINGIPVENSDWVVAIQINEEVRCGGALIDNLRVVTAAHCMPLPEHIYKMRVLINSVNFSDVNKIESENGENSFVVALVANYLKHPDYSKNGHIDNDIGIVFLTEPLSGHNFKFAQLPKPDQKFESNEAEALGWGITETGELSEVLLKTHMKTITNEECIAKAPENLKDVVYPSDICANGREIDLTNNLEGDGCGGDSGSPLRIGEVFIGVFSKMLGKDGCGRPGGISMYVRVSSYLDWINQNKEPVVNDPSASPLSKPIDKKEEVKKVVVMVQNPVNWWVRNQQSAYPYNFGLPINYGFLNVSPSVWRVYPTQY